MNNKQIAELIQKKTEEFTQPPNPSGAYYDTYNRIVDPDERKSSTQSTIDTTLGIDRESLVAAKLGAARIEYPTGSVINFRGEWQEDTAYKVGDYVYLKDRRPGFYYMCVVAGNSSSKKRGYSGNMEPGWTLNPKIYDDMLIWQPVIKSKIDMSSALITTWMPHTLYYIGQYVYQESGEPIVFEDGTEIVYQLIDIITKIDWPVLPEQRIVDGTIEWETRLSVGYLLPPERLKEPTFYEFVQVVDYLHLHEELYFNDFLHKYNDLTKVRSKSLKEIIAETGYGYIADLLNLDDKELATLVKYINIISDMKGSLAGLEIVFNLLGISYYMAEWWEKNPKGTPHTWDLGIEVDIQKVAADMITKLLAFTRNYVYPTIEKFEITYKMNMAEMAIVMAGFIDLTYYLYPEKGTLFASTAGFVDTELPMEVQLPAIRYITIGGYIDTIHKVPVESASQQTIFACGGTIRRRLNFVMPTADKPALTTYIGAGVYSFTRSRLENFVKD